ncbi:MAG: transcription-repair coupling factor [Chlamydiales bacterium]|nr:transcription-repair coupling factor [Chlamydiales bacterium]
MLDQIGVSPFFVKLAKIVKEQSSILLEDVWDTPKALMIHFLHQELKSPIIVITSGNRENRLYDDLRFFSDHIIEFPAWEVLPGEEILPSHDIVGKRFDVLNEIASATTPPIILCSLQAVLQKVPSRHLLASSYLVIRAQDSIGFEHLISQIIALGYEKASLVNDKGQYAVRGGIIDIFPLNSPHPYRLDFFGDDIEQIKIFDPQSQKSMDKTSIFHLCPANELSLLEKDSVFFMDYFNKKPVVIFDDLLSIEDTLTSLKGMAGYKSKWMLSFDDFWKKEFAFRMFWSKNPVEELSETIQERKIGRKFFSGDNPLEAISFEMFGMQLQTNRMFHPFDSLADFFSFTSPTIEIQKQQIGAGVQKIADSSIHLFLVSEHETERNKMVAWIPTRPKNTQFVDGYLSSGFAMRDLNLVVISYIDLTQRYKVSRKKWRSTYHTPVSEFHQLEIGDFVVHFHNGIGKYLGVEKQKNHLGMDSEFLIIEYAEGSKLFVPASQAHLVSKYIGAQHEKPSLHKIGTTKWAKAKQLATQAVIGYAKDLLQIQAEREAKGGIVYPEDSIDMIEFEEEFPYVETDDQLLAIDAIKQDMCSDKAMDRLICGDVGYGKTEVAMRAAFKAVSDGNKQVAVLVPTTVLAMQHYDTFKSRMQNFPLKVGIVSRFQKPKECEQILGKVANGQIDVLVGTHRLLSQDIIFKDLGLIIIDEEQRFGVRAKEKLKRIKTGVDCITLTATPIPRTLYMSLINIKDMSVINSPPQDRLPIKTIICEKENDIIKNAILRELSRDGQVYFIHNRVESIFGIAEEIQKLIPQVKLAVVHGQMDADRIDQIFHDFKSGSIDVLVATSIVENGIDIPNANTILIDQAHHFGVADLYQLRGRVGRWNKTAYAYFLTPKHRELPEISQKRLQALVEASGYGGGMKLAMRDLEIRGAGDILGIKQSGHVSTVGFHLYCKLLKKAIEAIKNHTSASFNETKIECTFDAKLPEYYIDDASIRLEIYHRLGEASTVEEVDLILMEITDRFGKAPDPVMWLYHLSRIRIFAAMEHIISLKYDKHSLHVEKQSKKEIEKKSFLIPPGLSPKEIELITIKRIKEGF